MRKSHLSIVLIFICITLLLFAGCSCAINRTRESMIVRDEPKRDYRWLRDHTKWASAATNPSPLPGIDRIYGIVLPKRHKSFSKAVENIQLQNSVNILEAFNKDQVDPHFPYMGGDFVTTENKGRVACNISHAMVLRDFLDSGAKTALIFEDDIKPIDEADRARMIDFLETVKHKKWDLLHLGFDAEQVGPDEEIKPGAFRAYTPFMTHAFAVTRPTAELLLPLIFPATKAIDLVIVEHTSQDKLVSYAINPPLFMQNRDTLSSEIGNFQPPTPFHQGRANRNRDQ